MHENDKHQTGGDGGAYGVYGGLIIFIKFCLSSEVSRNYFILSIFLWSEIIYDQNKNFKVKFLKA